MEDKKEIKAEELTDEQANEVSGGWIIPVAYKCANRDCYNKVYHKGAYCETCISTGNMHH